MNNVLKKIKDIHAEGCVTILLNTHRTKPDNQHDPILLKNLVKEATERLLNDFDKREAKVFIERLDALVEKINHNFNLDSMAIFVNKEIAEVTRLPIPVENRVVIDNTFATRDLVRAMHQQEAYYVMALSRDKARLIEAANDKVVQEIGGDFPYENNTLHTTERHDLSTAKGTDNLIEEFFNRVDKTFQTAFAENPLPLVLCTEERNYHHYLKVADKKHLVIGHLNKNRLDEKAHHIVADSWPIVHQYNRDNNSKRLQELKQAIGTGKFLSDFNEIWTAILEGRGQTLFVAKGYFQPARLNNGAISLVTDAEAREKDVIDDIIDDMIENNMRFGGDVVFLAKEDLKEFQGLALVTRY